VFNRFLGVFLPYKVLAGSYHLFKRLLFCPKVGKKALFGRFCPILDVRNPQKNMLSEARETQKILHVFHDSSKNI
jgi:hypothetical protein